MYAQKLASRLTPEFAMLLHAELIESAANSIGAATYGALSAQVPKNRVGLPLPFACMPVMMPLQGRRSA